MKSFAEAWPEESILQQAAVKIPWFHNCVLIEKVKDSDANRGTAGDGIRRCCSKNRGL